MRSIQIKKGKAKIHKDIPQKDRLYPKNKEHFIKLKDFGKVIINICNNLGISPIANGSLVYFAYTKSNHIKVNDIDLLVTEDSFKKLIKVLSKKKIRYKYIVKWHTLSIFKGNLKVEMESCDHWQINLKKCKNFDFGGLVVKIVSLKQLRYIYKWSSKHSITRKYKREEYCKKANALTRWMKRHDAV